MRPILAAGLLLSPLFISVATFAAQPVTGESASAIARPLSAGVTPARVISTATTDLTPAALGILPYNAEVVLTLNVDAKGQPQNVQVVKSPNRYLDAPVVAAVRQYRFRPATLDNQAVATPITLTVVVQR